MRIMLVADGRSPITRRWVQGLQALHHEIVLVSTFPCAQVEGVSEQRVLPVAFSNLAGSQVSASGGAGQPASGARRAISRFRGLFLAGRYWLGPLTLITARQKFRSLVKEFQPDLVHALRIPFEGMLAAAAPKGTRLVVSIWGNDLTLHGRGSAWMRSLTTQTLRRADGLLADAQRDLRLARLWGLPENRPARVVPGSGGIDLAEINARRGEMPDPLGGWLPPDAPLVLNPRGFRPGSVRNDVFFEAIPLVLERMPQARFACAGMAGQAEALRWVEQFHIGGQVNLLPFLPQAQLWELFRRAAVMVSVSAHDGTPNSLLEAMSIGCFPLAGDIESLREWITPGINGLLVQPDKPQALAEALLLALEHPELRSTAAEINQRIIRERAEANLVRAQVQVFYQQVLGSTR